MTPAINLLKKLKVDFKLHEYEHDTNVSNFGLEASEKLGFDPERIFKTLLISLNGEQRNLAVMMIPVSSTLNLKQCASVLKVKKVDMANKEIAQKTTGYLIGGISPLGQKKFLTTFIDESAKNFPTIFISGGKRGLDIEIEPLKLAEIIKANFAKIALDNE